jgi:tetratricopeptide (TPR) repeat protein
MLPRDQNKNQPIKLCKMRIQPFFASVSVMYLTLTLFSTNLNAQFFEELSNPTVSITLKHPPGFGVKVNKIAFGPSSGTCSDEIIDALISDFVTNNIEVVDRANLNTILQEHSFTLSGSVDQTSAAALGKILGPTMLIFVNVQRCAVQQDKLYDKETKYDAQKKVNYVVYAFISRTRAFLKVSVRTVDLATGRIFAAQSFEYSPEKSNKSYEGYPEFPAAFDVQDEAVKYAVSDMHKMYFPWNENRSLYFFDDKAYNLKNAYKSLESADIDQALELSKQNLEECKKDNKAKDKFLAHANYNLGMCHMLREEYSEAMGYFNEAKKFKSGSIITDAIAQCETAKNIKESMQRVENKATLEAVKTQVAEEKNAQTETANTLTNTSIIDMVKLKLPESVIIQKINSSKCKFDTTPNGLAALANAKISEKIMIAMIGKQ